MYLFICLQTAPKAVQFDIRRSIDTDSAVITNNGFMVLIEQNKTEKAAKDKVKNLWKVIWRTEEAMKTRQDHDLLWSVYHKSSNASNMNDLLFLKHKIYRVDQSETYSILSPVCTGRLPLSCHVSNQNEVFAVIRPQIDVL